MLVRSSILWLALPLTLAACVPAPEEADYDADVEVVPEGKQDDYFSVNAREYFVEGTARLTIEDALVGSTADQKLARAKELLELKAVQIGWFLNIRLTDKDLDVENPKHGDANAKTYPGYHAIVRTGEWSLTDLAPLADGKTFSFHVKMQVAGQKNLITRLPGTAISGSKKKFTLQMGIVSNEDLKRTDPETGWFRDEPWGSGTFDPTRLTADKLEPLELTMTLQPDETDAFLDLKSLYADGKLSIDSHYGWDYNKERYDLVAAEGLYDRLIGEGFTSPARTFKAYRPADGALTKSVTIDGQPVAIEVRIYHAAGKSSPGNDPGTDEGGLAMEKDMRNSLATRDVVIFSGHSGQYYGFALADWKRTPKGVLDYPQISAARLADKYQIVLASGCNTFSTGQAFRDNVSKPDLDRLNVVTTNTYSDATSSADANALLDAIYGGSARKFSPRPVSSLLQSMDPGKVIGAMYGLHGIDGNPKLHPFARLDTLGDACTTNTDCGGEGNRCTKVGSKRACSATCTATAGCPSGFTCRDVAATGSTTIVGKQCLK